MSDEIVIGGYRRVRVMQTGQTSEVWEVSEAGSGHRYCMKLLLHDKMQNWEHIGYMKHEYRVGKALDHKNCIKMLKIERSKQDGYYLLMEYFPSINLKQRMMAKENFEKFLKPNLRKIMEQSLAALGYMHSKKWVHRDIKPENIIVNSMAEVRLIDFALACRPYGAFLTQFTGKRKAVGTRSYMSPEQIIGRSLDRRADIYSFGIMLYQIVAGRLPFIGSSGSDLLRKHIHSKPDPIDPKRGHTPQFEKLILEMLSKGPKNRPSTADDVASRLRSIQLWQDESAEDNQRDSSAMRSY